MHMTVLFASPRAAHSNTRALLVPFLETWRAAGHTAEVFSLFDLHIEPCRACRGCQMDWEHPACVLADDMPAIFDAVLCSDILLGRAHPLLVLPRAHEGRAGPLRLCDE